MDIAHLWLSSLLADPCVSDARARQLVQEILVMFAKASDPFAAAFDELRHREAPAATSFLARHVTADPTVAIPGRSEVTSNRG